MRPARGATRARVLLAVASFAPQYGGPALSVSRLGAALAARGTTVGLWAPDGSATRSPVVDAMAAHAQGAELVRLPAHLDATLEMFGPPDIVHDNGIWRPHNHALARRTRRLGVPRVVSPRGMLEPWAFRHKPIKKALAFRAYQRRDLVDASALHATSDAEAVHLTAYGLGVPVHVVRNGIDVPGRVHRPRDRAPGSHRTMLFLGRVHPVKGLPLLVESLARVRPNGWRLVIAGPDEAGHMRSVRAMVRAAGLQEMTDFVGAQYGEAKARLLAEADLFVLPTHSENFGMAVAEALAHGVPVLTTTGAPWRLLSERRCGWWVPPTVDGIAGGLSEAIALEPEELAAMGRRGREAVEQTFAWDTVAQDMMQLYGTLCAAPRRTDPVSAV